MSENYPEDEQEPVIGDAPPAANTLVSNSVYDNLKQVAQIWLPALAVFYITIAPFWNLPKQEEVSGTIMALDLLLGAILMGLKRAFMNSEARFDGQILVQPGEEPDTSMVRVQAQTAAVAEKDEVVLKVRRV